MVNGVPGMPPGGMDPETTARLYAQQNGISIEEARNQLRAKYGDPKPPQGMSMDENIPGLQFSGEGSNFELNPYTAVPQDPQKLEEFIKKGAQKAGCTEREFAQMMGIPDREPKDKTPTADGGTLKEVVVIGDKNKFKPNTALALNTTVTPQGINGDEGSADIRMSSKDRKAWIKDYQATHNCSKKEAKQAFKEQFEYDVMSHKDAIAWVKNYMKEHNCKKSEAKDAFKDKFGYEVPLSTIGKVGRMLVAPVYAAGIALGTAPVIGVAGLAAAGGIGTGLSIGSALSLGPNNSDKIYHQKA